MSSPLRPKARLWPLPLLTLPALLARCSGTEADNPVTDLVVTECKSSGEYDPEQVNRYWASHAPAQLASAPSSQVPKSTRAPSGTAALTPTADFGIGLECIEWRLSALSLQLQVVNWRAGCGAEWQGRTQVHSGAVELALRNDVCAIASCGNCLYDTATSVELAETVDLPVTLSMDASCDGHPDLLQWTLPLTQRTQGLSCRYARGLGLGDRTDEAFLPCGAEGSCDAGLECTEVGDPSGPRCLPPCASDADCPFAGGTRCDARHCVPDATVPFSGSD